MAAAALMLEKTKKLEDQQESRWDYAAIDWGA